MAENPGTSETAARVADIVEAALELERSEWPSFLDRECNGERALRAEVESLLGYREQAAEFIEGAAIHANAEFFADEGCALEAGQLLAQYRVLSLIGAGGMGEVYLAQDLSLGRQVVLKLVKHGSGGRELLRRFHQEERILAGLTHPNIARLYGAAATDGGVPYFVMEYVEGERLDEFCTLRQLPVADRLRLFRKICAAVGYAHQHLVIHRDLKPANIWVTPEGEPKLLDFGIAKLLDPENDTSPEQTVTLLGMMTPEYASPEQVRGETMTTASDVYSLGVILYELLAGQKPYRLTTRQPAAIARAITEQVPPRPSTAVASTSISAISKQKSLRGDLDNIVLMAMRKEPERRYASVALFAEDIRRHLEGLPVIARKDTLRYRSAKFVTRHKFGVAAAGLVLATLVGGIVATQWEAERAEQQRARAERRFAQVRRLANSLVFELHAAIENLPGSTQARELLVKRALEYLDSLAAEASDDPSLQRELLFAYIKAGNAQGNPNNANLGDTAGALQSYDRARAIAEQLAAAQPDGAQNRRALAVCLEKTSEVQAITGNLVAAVASARASLAAFQTNADADPADGKARRALAISHLKMGDLLGNPNFTNAGNAAGALQSYRTAIRILDSAQAAEPADVEAQRLLSLLDERVGTMLESQGEIAAARESYAESQRSREQLAVAHPDNAELVRDVAVAREKMGNVLTSLGDLAGALEHRRASLEVFQRLAEADPRNVQAQRSLAISHMHLGDLLGAPDRPNLNRPAEALQHYRLAQNLLDQTKGANGADAKALDALKGLTARISALESAARAAPPP